MSDCAEALSLFVAKGKPGEIYDICSRPEYAVTMEGLAHTVIAFCNKKFKPIIKEAPVTDTKVKLPSGYKTYVELGWEPQMLLGEGIWNTIEWMKKYKGVLVR